MNPDILDTGEPARFEYTLEYTRTMTVEAAHPMTVRDLIDHAADELLADGALWNVRIAGKTYALGRFAVEDRR